MVNYLQLNHSYPVISIKCLCHIGDDPAHERLRAFFWTGFVGAIISALINGFLYVAAYDWLALYSATKYAVIIILKVGSTLLMVSLLCIL